jgi:Ca2+-binding RTX toxin-like protein
MADFQGTDGADTIIGTDFDDIIRGGDGDDSLNGGAGNDTLEGGTGGDTLLGGAGNDLFIVNSDTNSDLFDGGEGIDTISFENLSNGFFTNVGNVEVDGLAELGLRVFGIGYEEPGRDRILNVENIIGTRFQDFIDGNDADNHLIGNGGSDVLDGREGADTLEGAATSEIGDAVNYADSPSAVAVNLLTGTTSGGFAEGDVLINITRIFGSDFSDLLIGSDGGVRFDGRDGNDTLIGGRGDDSLVAGDINGAPYDDNNNLIQAGSGDDYIRPSFSGADTIDGGAGNDLVDYTNNYGVTVDLETGIADKGVASSGAFFINDDLLTGIEHITGSGEYGDVILGSSSNNAFIGGGGNDRLEGRGGSDSLNGDAGDDTLIGGTGDDVLSAGLGANLIIFSNGHGQDTLLNPNVLDIIDFSNLTEGAFSNFNGLLSNAAEAVIDGVSGVLIETGSNSSLLLTEITLTDLNRLNFLFSDGSSSTNENAGVVGIPGEQTDQDDVITGIQDGYGETIEGGAGDDTLSSGNDYSVTQNDLLDGGPGNDLLVGRDTNRSYGGDTLLGGDGDDTLQGLQGSDLLDGGPGDDLLEGGIGGPISYDTLQGGDGNDILIGNANSIVIGGAGADTLTGGIAEYKTSPVGITINFETGLAEGGDAQGDVLESIWSIVGSSFNDVLLGRSVSDNLKGGDGADFLRGDDGDDDLSGGAGNDQIFAGPNDTGADSMQGNSGNDVLGGGAGNDVIVGGDLIQGANTESAPAAGSDTLFGGTGNDLMVAGAYKLSGNSVIYTDNSANTLYAGSGADTLFGDNGNDVLGGGAGGDQIDGGGGNDTLYGGVDTTNNADTLSGGDGNDLIFAAFDQDRVTGGAGNDTLFGGAGNDTVDGGAGADSIYGGAGDDVMTGGSGIDSFLFYDNHGIDTVTDFGNSDVLDLANTITEFTDFASFQAAVSTETVDGQSGVLVDTGGGNSIFLVGIDILDISESNIMLSA